MSGHLHLECPSGLAGDMFLAGCIELGVPVELIKDVVDALGLADTAVETFTDRRGGIVGRRFRVLHRGLPVEGLREDSAGVEPHEGDDHSKHAERLGESEQPKHRSIGHPTHHHAFSHGPDESVVDVGDSQTTVPATYAGVQELLVRSSLSAEVKERSLEMVFRLAEVEGQVHGIPIDRVHFHELSAVDSLVDIVGSAAVMAYLNPDRVTCGTVVVGSGTVGTRHGLLAVPAPATVRLLFGVPTTGGGSGELTTPTGALILKTFVDEFGPQPRLVIDRVGHGLGTRELVDRPNAACLFWGTVPPMSAAVESPKTGARTQVVVVECQVDDASGETVGFAVERLLQAGALDVFVVPVLMKKGRPGHLLTVTARPNNADDLATIMMRETGSLGCRFHDGERRELERRKEEVTTVFGPVRIKVGRLDNRDFVTAPEAEDCADLARQHGVSWREVYLAALAAWRSRGGPA